MIHWQYITFPPINLLNAPLQQKSEKKLIQAKNLEKIERDTPESEHTPHPPKGDLSTGRCTGYPQEKRC